METFSPIDSVELLSSPSQIDTSKAGSKWWIWGILIAVILAIGVYLFITQPTPKQRSKDKNA